MAAFRMALSTGNAVKLRHVPQNRMNDVVLGFFQVGPLLELLMSDHHRDRTAPRPKGKAIDAAA